MKKVLHYVSIMNRAGQETFIMNVFRNIDREQVKFDFLVTSSQKGDYDQEIEKLGGKIHHLTLNRFKGKYKQIDNFFLLKKKLMSFSQEYDIFHIHTQHAMDAFFSALAAKQVGIKKVIVHSHNASTIYSKVLHNIFKKLVHYLKIERFACGNEAGKWMFGNDRYTIINNGIDLSNFLFYPEKRVKIREQMKWNKNEFIIGHVGRFNKQKNHKFIIEIFEKYLEINKNAKLVLVGTGELENEVRKMVKIDKIQDKVEFLGLRSDVNQLYAGMDAFIFPSLFEGLPVVLVETQAADLPIIMSDTITNEIKINDNVDVLPLDNNSSWLRALRKIDETNAVRKDTSEKMLKKGYDIHQVANKLQKIYLK